MNSSDQNPNLPTWIFFATDLALIGAALAIAVWSPHPLPTTTILWIVTCVVLGAIVGLVPLVVRYERQKNALLDERQQALEALARTVSSSAEQISIAAGGLHQIAELASKNVRMAEHLPHKLQDKMAEFQALLAAGTDAEKEELERELLALRTTESERLESVSQRIAKSSAEWTKLEAVTHEHLTAANEAVAKLAFGTASAIGKAQAAAEQALSQARVEAARAVGDASGHATRAVESATTAALAALDAKVATATTTIVERVVRELNARLARLEPGDTSTPRASVPAVESSAAAPSPSPDEAPPTPPGGESGSTSDTPDIKQEATAQPPKRPRKVRRDDPASLEHASPSPVSPSPTEPTDATTPPPATNETSAPTPPLGDEPLPVPTAKIPEITPVAPATAEPFSDHLASTPNGTPSPRPAGTSGDVSPVADHARTPRKRPAKKLETDDEPGLGLELDDAPGNPSGAGSERVLSSDGATRLIVTAYIGIGNRLYIRGSGPGLSWEKGVPLQFVSIGKWRWETNDASAPLEFKLYKNDDVECTALGTQALDPGYQQEVTAAF